MKTAMQDLRDMIEKMTENGGDYDLLCVLGLIDDSFLNKEKIQIKEAYESNLWIGFGTGEEYYNEVFKKQ